MSHVLPLVFVSIPESVRPARLLGALSVAALLVTLGGWGYSIFRSAFGCYDNAACVSRDSHRHYRGRLFDYEGRPAPGFRLLFRSDVYERWSPVRTDDAGRFCTRAFADTTPSVRIPGQESPSLQIVRSDRPVDPRFADPGVRDRLRRRSGGSTAGDRMAFVVAEPAPGVAHRIPTVKAVGAYEAPELWDEERDASPTCDADAGQPAWYRFTDQRGSWQFLLLNLGPLLVLLTFVVGGTLRFAFREAAAAYASVFVGCALALVNLVLVIILWRASC